VRGEASDREFVAPIVGEPAAVSRLDVARRLTGEFGQPIELRQWWIGALEALDDDRVREIILSVVRQTGKSQLLSTMAISELLTKPGSYTVLMSASSDQATAIFLRKIKRPLERLLKELGMPKGYARFTLRGVEIPSLGSVLELLAANESTAPGRTPTLLLVDEARDVRDETFAALVPSVVGAGGKIVVASSAGAPKGFFYELATNPTEETWLYRSSENDNPHSDKRVLSWLKRRLAVLAPSAARRELDNEFTEGGDDFLPAALIEAAIDDSLVEVQASDAQAFGAADLSRKRDFTTVLVVARMPPRRPEAADHLVVLSIATWDPRQSPTRETDFAEVRAHVAELPQRFRKLQRLLVDEGAEAGSLLPFARAQATLTMIVEGYVGSLVNNAAIWGALAARLHARTLSIPRHERLIAELRSLRQETIGGNPSKWRVVDSTRRLHRDVSLALAVACFAAGDASPEACGAVAGEVQDAEMAPIGRRLSVLGASAARMWPH